VANNAGAYTIMGHGNYALLAFETNYITNTKNAPVLTLGSGATISTNLTLTNATASITGQIVDAANNAIGLTRCFHTGAVHQQKSDWRSLFTDTNGNFTAGVIAGQWSWVRMIQD